MTKIQTAGAVFCSGLITRGQPNRKLGFRSMLARLGGDEFILLLPETNLVQARNERHVSRAWQLSPNIGGVLQGRAYRSSSINVAGARRRCSSSGTMRGLLRTTIVVILALLAFCLPGYATCDNGSRVCEPSVQDARAILEKLLNSALLTPYSLNEFEKLDGRLFETVPRKRYRMRILAVVNYSGDAWQCRTKHCPELHNYLVEINKVEKKAKIAGWLLFEEEASGWRYAD